MLALWVKNWNGYLYHPISSRWSLTSGKKEWTLFITSIFILSPVSFSLHPPLKKLLVSAHLADVTHHYARYRHLRTCQLDERRWDEQGQSVSYDETRHKKIFCFQDNKFISRQMFTTEYVSVNKPSPEQSAPYLCLCQRDIGEFHGIFANQALSPTVLWWRGFRSVICHFKRFFAGDFSFSVKTRSVSCWVATKTCIVNSFTVRSLLLSKIYSPAQSSACTP